MNLTALNPLKWGRGGQAVSGGTSIADNREDDPWLSIFEGALSREHNPEFWERLREAMPIFDIAIQKLCAMDGIIKPVSDNPALQNAIAEFMEQVRVNDMQSGYQSFYRLLAGESYEQGCAIGDFVYSDDQTAVVQLNVADSKGIVFERNASGAIDTYYAHPSKHTSAEPLQQLMRSTDSRLSVAELISNHHYTKLAAENLVYIGYNVEPDTPYGVSMMRSTEFVSKVLATMLHSLERQWNRFGDPVFSAKFKSGVNRDPKKLDEIKTKIASDIAAVMKAKAQGKSADLVNAIGNKDELDIDILGALESVLDIKESGSFIVNQLSAKTGLPAWVLGIGQAGQDAMREAEMVLMESRQRFAERKAALKKPIIAHLRAKGLAFNHNDWDLEQQLPSVSDVVAQAQATFLNAQARMMDPDHIAPDTLPAQDVENEGEKLLKKSLTLPCQPSNNTALKAGKWAEDDKQLPRLNQRAESYLMAVWKRAQEELLRILKLDGEQQGSDLFEFNNTPEQKAQMDKLLTDTPYLAAAIDGGLVAAMIGAHERGLINATRELKKPATSGLLADAKRDILALRQNALREHALEQATNSTTLSLKDRIYNELIDGDYNNLDPQTVAARLKQRFADRAINYKQIAQAEVAQAHVIGKAAQFEALGVAQYNYKNSGDSKVSNKCLVNTAGGPYPIGKGPLPVTDSHPDCRCTIEAVLDD